MLGRCIAEVRATVAQEMTDLKYKTPEEIEAALEYHDR
jgi:hypothetical protein